MARVRPPRCGPMLRQRNAPLRSSSVWPATLIWVRRKNRRTVRHMTSSNANAKTRGGERTMQARSAQFFGLKRNLVLLLATIIVISTGEELWMRFLPKYLQAIGAAVFVIGTFDALRTAIGAVYAYPGGMLVDRFGHRNALVFFTIISITGYTLVALVPHWSAVIGAMFLFLAWTCCSLPAAFSLVATTLGREQHAMGIAVQSVV